MWRRSRCWWRTSARLPAAERERQLALLGAGSAAALRARLQPRLVGRLRGGRVCAVRLERPSLDGRNHLALELRADPREATMQVGGRTVSFRLAFGSGAVRLTVRIATDAAPLTPLARDSIFNPAVPGTSWPQAGAADSASPSARRLEREVRERRAPELRRRS